MGTKSQPTQTIEHSSGNTSQGLVVAAVNYCFVHTRRAVACIGRARQGQHEIAQYIRKCSHYMSWGHVVVDPRETRKGDALRRPFAFPVGLQQQVSLLAGYRAFSHDVTATILVFQNNETAAMLVYQTSPVGVQLFSYVNTSFCSNKFACELAT